MENENINQETMDFLNNQIIYKSSEEFKPIYKYFLDHYKIKYSTIFVICASLGFVNNKSSKCDRKNGAELRTNYFDSKQKASLYTILLNDKSLNLNVEKFDDKEVIRTCGVSLESYAQGGMEILIKNVFKSKWDGNMLDSNYDDYYLDVMKYIFDNYKE